MEQSTKLHETPGIDCNKLLGNTITSNYRKCENGVKHKINNNKKKVAESLFLSKKIKCFVICPPFVIIKDHKQNFEITPNADELILPKMN